MPHHTTFLFLFMCSTRCLILNVRMATGGGRSNDLVHIARTRSAHSALEWIQCLLVAAETGKLIHLFLPCSSPPDVYRYKQTRHIHKYMIV